MPLDSTQPGNTRYLRLHQGEARPWLAVKLVPFVDQTEALNNKSKMPSRSDHSTEGLHPNARTGKRPFFRNAASHSRSARPSSTSPICKGINVQLFRTEEPQEA